MPRFVLEIGTEELPPRFFPPALAQLRQEGEAMFGRARLSFTELKVYGTPRRLVLIAENLAARQAPLQREERGPAARVAFDKDGNPTKAAQGFAARYKLKPEDLIVRKTEQGEYVYALIQETELPAKEALPSLLPDLITSLSFPKTMRWGTGKLRFGRPIRWLLALLDSEVVPFELDGIKSGNLTRGHPVLFDTMFPSPGASHYEADLEAYCVLVNPERRREVIRLQLEQVASQTNTRLVDGGLLEETTFLVEWPTTALGCFDPHFLDLPRPVLIDEMQHVQSYFPLEDDGGNLLPKFIAVRDGGEDHLDIIIRGWENVLRAKLIDADFFYHQDLKIPLADRVEALKGVVFQEKLGSIYDKVERVRAVATAITKQLGLSSEQAAQLDRAALLCKADLTTEVVTDLSNLQGIMGREYALASGEDSKVAEAIGEHYRPRFAGDAIPQTRLGRLLALADKLDTLASLFAIGVVPTGSADPFGLRREAYGIVNILLAAGQESDNSQRFTVSLGGLLRIALAILRNQFKLDIENDNVSTAIMDFIRDRLMVSLRDREFRYDLVEAAVAVGVDDVSLASRRAWALVVAEAWDSSANPSAPFLPTVIACTRPINIAKGFAGGEVNPTLFEHESEKHLWEAYQQVLAQADSVKLVELFKLFADYLREPIDRFFDDVLVMHENEKIRNNRLALCWQLSQLFRKLADFTLIVQV